MPRAWSFNSSPAVPGQMEDDGIGRLLMSLQSTEILLDPFEASKTISIPAIMFISDREAMSIVSQETTEEIRAVNDKIQVIHLKGGSHFIRHTRFDGFVPTSQTFLDSVRR